MNSLAHYLEALAAVVRRSAIPYGYTITIWTSGAVLEHGHGTPDIGQAFLFLIGAVGGFAAVALIASRSAPRRFEPARADLMVTGAIHALALGLALGATALVAMIRGGAAWPIGSFAATAIYLLVASVELVLAHRGAESASDGD